MPDKKPSSLKLKQLRAEAQRLEREIGKAGLFAEGVKSEFWRAMEIKLKDELQGIESKLDNYRGLTDNQIRDLLADRLKTRGFLGVKDFVKAKTMFENRLTLIKARIEEQHAKLDSR